MAEKLVPLKEYVSVQGGYAFKSADFTEGGVKVVKIANIQPPSVNLDGCDCVSDEVIRGLERFRLHKGDLLLAMTGATIGKVGRLESDEPCYLNQRVARLIPHDSKHAALVKALTDSIEFRSQVESIAHGSAQPNISASHLEEIEVPFVEPSLRALVSSALVQFDDKIELNRKMNETLEQMARAIFKSWFIDFDPVHAKRQGKKPFGMDDATAALFPDSFEQSGLGEIPKGWRHGSLGDVITNFDSKRVPLSSREREQRRGSFPYYGAASLMDHVDTYLFDGVHVLVGEDGSVINEDGTPVTQYVWGQFWVNNHAHVLKGKGISEEHLLTLLRTLNIAAYVTGAVQPKLNQGNLNKVPLVIAPTEVNKVFADRLKDLYHLFRLNTEETLTLSTTRDLLLPRLLSGELTIKEAST